VEDIESEEERKNKQKGGEILAREEEGETFDKRTSRLPGLHGVMRPGRKEVRTTGGKKDPREAQK